MIIDGLAALVGLATTLVAGWILWTGVSAGRLPAAFGVEAPTRGSRPVFFWLYLTLALVAVIAATIVTLEIVRVYFG